MKSGLAPSGVLSAVLALGMVVSGCDTSDPGSLYDSNRVFDAAPIISAIEPDPPSLAGIGTLTIRGENFSPVPSNNLVFFNRQRATVVGASPTQLTVRTPNLVGSGLNVRVSVLGAEDISNSVSYGLESAVESFGDIQDFEEVFGITIDPEGHLYMSLFSTNVSAGIKRISPNGERSDYVASTFKWDALSFDQDGFLYGVRNVRAIFRFPVGGGNAETWAVADDSRARFRSLDVDAEGRVWVAGSGGNIYRIDPEGEIEAFAAAQVVNALRVAGGHVYIAEEGSPDRVISRSIESNGTLGSEEVIFVAPAGVSVLSLAITAAKEVIVGTDAADPLYIVSPGGQGEVLYPDLLRPSAIDMVWGDGPMLHVVQGRTSTTRSDLYILNTQREGAR